MELADLFKKFDKCMRAPTNHEGCGNCPLLGMVRLSIGEKYDVHGGITWNIQACSLMDILSKSLKRRLK